MTTQFSKAAGRRVIAGDSADDVGAVKTFVLDETGRQVTKLQVAGSKRKAELVNWEDVQTFGPDTVIINSSASLHEVEAERSDEMVRGAIDYHRARILGTDGRELGTVSDVHFDEDTGAILQIVGDEVGQLDSSAVKSLGSYAVVVEAQE